MKISSGKSRILQCSLPKTVVGAREGISSGQLAADRIGAQIYGRLPSDTRKSLKL